MRASSRNAATRPTTTVAAVWSVIAFCVTRRPEPPEDFTDFAPADAEAMASSAMAPAYR